MKIMLDNEARITTAEAKKAIKALNAGEASKGATIRILFAGGWSVKEISDATAIKYNHVYNVCRNEVYKHHLEESVCTEREGGTKKQDILAKLESGMSITEVSKELGCLYNQVWQVAKAAGLTAKQRATVEVNVG